MSTTPKPIHDNPLEWLTQTESDNTSPLDTKSLSWMSASSRQSEGDTNLPDWLDTSQTSAADMAQWQAGQRGSPSTPPSHSTAPTTDDWLSNMGPAPTTAQTETHSQPQANLLDDSDDWLDALSGPPQPSDQPSNSQSSAPQLSSDDDSWLTDFQPLSDEAHRENIVEVNDYDDSDDWLANLTPPSAEPDESQQQPDHRVDDSDDWLADFGSQPPSEEDSETDPALPINHQDNDDWLADLADPNSYDHAVDDTTPDSAEVSADLLFTQQTVQGGDIQPDFEDPEPDVNTLIDEPDQKSIPDSGDVEPDSNFSWLDEMRGDENQENHPPVAQEESVPWADAADEPASATAETESPNFMDVDVDSDDDPSSRLDSLFADSNDTPEPPTSPPAASSLSALSALLPDEDESDTDKEPTPPKRKKIRSLKALKSLRKRKQVEADSPPQETDSESPSVDLPTMAAAAGATALAAGALAFDASDESPSNQADDPTWLEESSPETADTNEAVVEADNFFTDPAPSDETERSLDWLDSPASPAEATVADTAPDNNLDWLDDFPTTTQSPSSTEPAAASTESDELGWLSDLSQSPASAEPEPTSTKANELDWLSGLSQPPSSDEPEPASTEANELNWLSDLSQSSEDEQSPAIDTATASPVESDLSWLDDIQPPDSAAAPESATTDQPPQESSHDELDWLANLSQPTSSEPLSPNMATNDEAADSLSWLEDLSQPADTLAPFETATSAENSETGDSFIEADTPQTDHETTAPEPDWLEPQADSEPDTLDWLNDISASPATDDSETPPWMTDTPNAESNETLDSPSWMTETTGAEATEAIPDWMQTDEAPSTDFEVMTAAGDSLIDDMTETDNDADDLPINDEPETSADSSLDWLETVSDSTNADQAETAPDWLMDLADGADSPPDEATAAISPESTPDWLADNPADESPLEEPFSVEETNSETNRVLQPDWLNALDLPSQTEPADSSWLDDSLADSTEDNDAEDGLALADWLDDEAPTPSDSAEQEAPPTWLIDTPTGTEQAIDIPAVTLDALSGGPTEGTDPPSELTAETVAPTVFFDSPPAIPVEGGPAWLIDLPDSDSAETETVTTDETATPVSHDDSASADDDWLGSFYASEDDELTDSETTEAVESMAQMAQDETPAESAWMSDLLETPITEESLIPASHETPAESNADELSSPDWVNELSTDTETQITPEAVTSPDWLDEAAPIDQTASDESEEDALGWLTPTTIAAGAAGLAATGAILSSQSETLDDADPATPDWLTDIPQADAELPDFDLDEQTETPTPDWLTDTDSSQDNDLETPDWLTDVPQADAEPSDFDLDEQTETPTPDWLTDTGSSQDNDLETPDWLADVPKPDPETPQFDLDTQAETPMPDWLTDTGSSQDRDLETPDWLADVPKPDAEPSDFDLDTQAETPTPDWLTDTGSSQDRDLETPDWLADVPKPDPETPQFDLDTQAETPMPDWLTDTGSSQDRDLETPDWLDDVPKPDAEFPNFDLDEQAETPTPDWLADVPKPDHETPQFDLDTQAETPTPDWLADMPQPDAELPQFGLDEQAETPTPDWLNNADSSQDNDLETPDWLNDEPKADAEPSDFDLDTQAETPTPDWLTDTGSSQDNDLDTPDWLADVPKPDPETPQFDLDTQAENPTPDWLTDTGSSQDRDLETPDWLTDVPQANAEPPDFDLNEQAETPTPDWLADTGSSQDNDLETPDWLADVPKPDPETPQFDLDTQAETPTPDWLAGAGSSQDNDLETPDWLADVPKPDAELPQFDSDEQAETPTPDWLADLPSADAQAELTFEAEFPELTSSIFDTPTDEPSLADQQADDSSFSSDTSSIAVTDDQPTPDWLADLPPAEADDDLFENSSSTDTPESDTSNWLGSAAIAAGAVGLAATGAILSNQTEESDEANLNRPDWLDETPQAETTEADTPDWLTDIPQADEESPELDLTGQDETTPDWLNETPQIETTEADTPDWLADIPKTDDEPHESAQDEITSPDWLDEIPQAEDKGHEFDLTDQDETTTPDWLNETPQAETTEPDTPDWLADIPQADDVSSEFDLTNQNEITPPDWLNETTQAETTEPDTPDWLADIPQAEDEPHELAQDEITSPDWLDETPQAETTEPDIPDWMDDIPQAEDEPHELGLTAQDDTSLPDWLDEAPQAETTEADTPDWLDEIPKTDDEPHESAQDEITSPDWLNETPQAETTEPDTPGWLDDIPQTDDTAEEDNENDLDWINPATIAAGAAGLAATGAILSTQDETETDTPDWLDDIPQANEESPKLDLTGQDETTPDWLDETPQDEITSPDTPDWLTDIPQAEDKAHEFDLTDQDEITSPDWLDETSQAETTEAETPDWLADIPQAEDKAHEFDLTDQDEITSPDWLDETPQVETTEADTPDWMDDIPQADDEPHELGLTAQDDTSLPDWLNETPQVETTEADTPDWLDDIPQAEDDPHELGLTAQDDTSLPDWLDDIPQTDDTAEKADEGDLDWVNPTTIAAGAAGVAATGAILANQGETEPDTPDWFDETPQAEDKVPELGLDAQVETPLPDWLNETPQAETAISDSSEDSPPLPDWLASVPSLTTQNEMEFGEDERPLPEWVSELPSGNTIDFSELKLGQQEMLADPTAIADEFSNLPETDDENGGSRQRPLPEWVTELATNFDGHEYVDLAIPIHDALPIADSNQEPELAPDDPNLPEPSWLTETPADEPSWLMSDASADLPEPDWLTEERPTDQADTPDWLNAPLPQMETEGDSPDWLADLTQSTPADAPAITSGDAADSSASLAGLAEDSATDNSPDWLTEAASSTTDPATPDWLIGSSDDVQTDWLIETETTETVTGIGEEAETTPSTTTESTIPDWLIGSSDDVQTDWLAETEIDKAPAEFDEGADTNHDNQEASETFEEPAAVPDWLTALQPDDTDLSVDSSVEPTPELAVDEDGNEDEPTMADWLSESNVTTEVLDEPEPIVTDIEPETVEGSYDSLPAATGLAATVAAAAVATTTALTASSAETSPDEAASPPMTALSVMESPEPSGLPLSTDRSTVVQAAQQFYDIATKPPKPVTSPAALTQGEKLVGNVVRATFYLLFMLLLTIPLLPGLQREVDGQTLAWTEPVGRLGETLAKQRRELISEALGAIDVQPPDSVALVSFDYTAATQGEMDPLAQALVARLRGQGMRVIAISLNPEGAALAQTLLEQISAQRNETYGEASINLGFVPGQVTGIRHLLVGPQALATLTDVQTGTPLAEQAAWQDINNLGQVSVIVTLADSATTARWWVEQKTARGGDQLLFAATSATARPFMQPYQDTGQLDGYVSGITGAAAIEATRNNYGPARQMLDSQSIAHIIIFALIFVGTVVGLMSSLQLSEPPPSTPSKQDTPEDEEAA